MKILPFGTTLAGLTLKGEHRDVAEAHHNLEGEALARRLIEITQSDEKELAQSLLQHNLVYNYITQEEFDVGVATLTLSGDELTKTLLGLQLKYNHITQEEFDITEIEATMTGDELVTELLVLQRKYKHISKEEYDYKMVELKYKNSKHDSDLPFARYELDKKYGKLTEKEFDKAVYSLGNRPWVDVINSEYKDSEKSDGFTFELDWNDAFVKMLREEGYNGATDESIVEQWFEDKSMDTYLGVLAEQMEDIGEDPEDVHARGRQQGRTLREQLSATQSKHS